MCLVAIAWRAHPRYPLVIAGNRDEFHERPSAPAAWWDEPAGVLGGRDLLAGGSWLAVSRGGRFAVVLNNPQRAADATTTASRGHLVSEFVAGNKPGGRFIDAVQVRAHAYAGFCLLLGTPVQVRGFASPAGNHPPRWTLRPGVAAFSNSLPAQPWPKVGHLERAVTRRLESPHLHADDLFALLAQREPVARHEAGSHPATRTPFVVGERYGTRSSTVVTISDAMVCEFEERRFSADGSLTGVTRERFAIG